jgi:hypothetical protein
MFVAHYRPTTSPSTSPPGGVCPPPPKVTCPETRWTQPPIGPGDGPCDDSVDCLPDAACIANTCRPFSEVDVTICVHQTAFSGPTCGGANLVHGVHLYTSANGGAVTGSNEVWRFENSWSTDPPRCAAVFVDGEACAVAPLDRLIYDGVIASPIVEGGPVFADYLGLLSVDYHAGHLGSRADILERLDAGCFDVPENNTVGHRSTLSIWGPQ